jgi:hypothetical protein
MNIHRNTGNLELRLTGVLTFKNLVSSVDDFSTHYPRPRGFVVGLPARSTISLRGTGRGGMVEIGFYQIDELPRLAFGVQHHWRFHPVTSAAPRSQCCNQRAARQD